MSKDDEILEFGEINRDIDRCFFTGSLEGNFALKCLNTSRREDLETELNVFASDKSNSRKYLDDRGYVYEFIKDSSLVRAIHVPCISYYGCLEMFQFSEEIIRETPEIYTGKDASRIRYGTVNIPNEECCEDVKDLMRYWIKNISKIIPK